MTDTLQPAPNVYQTLRATQGVVTRSGQFVACAVYDHDRLPAGNYIAGPAIVEQMDATTVVLPGMVGRVEPYLNLILEAA
jgi:N-methylhydantoinase A